MVVSHGMCTWFMAIQLIVWVVAVAADGPAVKYWEKMFPGVAMPASLRASLSPLDGSREADLYAIRLQQATFDIATSDSFCKAAGLVCKPNAVPLGCVIQSNVGQPSKRTSNLGTTMSNDEGFFLESDLVAGASMHLHGQQHGSALYSAAFLPKSVADVIPPLTSENLPNLRQIFHIPQGSKMSTAMNQAVSACQAVGLPGEKRACSTSMESMVDFVSSEVGSYVQVLEPQRVSVKGLATLVSFRVHDGGHSAVCHTMGFPSQLYSCHVVPQTKVLDASLTAADGSLTRAVGICHMDTTTWAPSYEAFAILNVQPGTPVCHWVDPNSLTWVSTKNNSHLLELETIVPAACVAAMGQSLSSFLLHVLGAIHFRKAKKSRAVWRRFYKFMRSAARAAAGEASKAWMCYKSVLCVMSLAATVVTQLLWSLSFNSSLFYGTPRAAWGTTSHHGC